MFHKGLDSVDLPGSRGDIFAEYELDRFTGSIDVGQFNVNNSLVQLMVHKEWIPVLFEFFECPRVDSQMKELERYGLGVALLYVCEDLSLHLQSGVCDTALAQLALLCAQVLVVHWDTTDNDVSNPIHNDMISAAWLHPRFDAVKFLSVLQDTIEKEREKNGRSYLTVHDYYSKLEGLSLLIRKFESSLRESYPGHKHLIDEALTWKQV